VRLTSVNVAVIPVTRTPAALEPLTEREEEAIAYGEAHLRVIAFIDRHLFDLLDLERIADVSGYSISEFSRRFTRQQGESVMAHVRGRRLEAAASRLLADPDARLLDLAIECGFDSQAAFTRGFGRAFGVSPGQLREGCGDAPPPRRRRTRTRAPALDERIEQLPGLTLVGLRQRFTPANYVEMGALWQRLVELRGSRRDETFGVFLGREPGGAFELFAATRAWPGAEPLLRRLTVPAGRYRVLRHHLHDGPLLPQMTAADPAIRDRARPATWDFQHYPANFGVVNRWIDHFVPLAAPRPTPEDEPRSPDTRPSTRSTPGSNVPGASGSGSSPSRS